ncbi:MAG: alkaline phosphatase [Solirubrobacteraceae bacterium]|nr:alkaline phosphatase [Solirubrobacteraceae bacterium]
MAQTRRELLRAGAAGALVLGGVPVDAWARGGRRRVAVPLAARGAFAEGIAAGAPKPRGIVLWTRLSGAGSGDQRLSLEVARDRDFRRTVLRRDVVARAGADGTAKVRVEGRRILDPGQEYFYRFDTRSSHSEVGRFRTLPPPDSRDPIRIGFFSCQDWQAGYFGAHRALAAEPELDFVVCLGDYIYERNFYKGPRTDALGANHDGEVQTLDEYRSKYRMYKSDADLRAMHAQHALYAMWDDHEVEDNYTGNMPGEATQQVRVPFAQRRANGYRAFAEYQPEDYMGRATRLYRNLRLGRNAELFILDERQYRDDQPCGDRAAVPCPEADAPGRTLLGAAQKAWFKRSLQASQARWKLVGNPLMMMSLDTAPNTPFLKDDWDGYGAERREIGEHIRAKRISDVAYVTGDIHTFFAGEVTPSGRGTDAVATEFVTGSVTSLGIPESVSGDEGARNAITPDQAFAVTQNVRMVNPHIKYDEQHSRGYGVVEAHDNELLVRYVSVQATPVRSTQGNTLARFRVASGTPRIQTL